ncbi:hypothetical protein P7C73_g4560, partial [Tremellales sp. Uapishka_1]
MDASPSRVAESRYTSQPCSPSRPPVARKKSAGSLLGRMGSVIRRNSEVPIGGTSFGGTWNKRRRRTEGTMVQTEEESESGSIDGWERIEKGTIEDRGDEGISRPFNIDHDLHVSPDLADLPPEWLRSLKAQGLSETDLMLISSSRHKQQAVKLHPHVHPRSTSLSAFEYTYPTSAVSIAVTLPHSPLASHFDKHVAIKSHEKEQDRDRQLYNGTPACSSDAESVGKRERRLSDEVRGFKSLPLLEAEDEGDWAESLLNGFSFERERPNTPTVPSGISSSASLSLPLAETPVEPFPSMDRIPQSPPPPRRSKPFSPIKNSSPTSSDTQEPRHSSESFGVHYSHSQQSSINLVTPSLDPDQLTDADEEEHERDPTSSSSSYSSFTSPLPLPFKFSPRGQSPLPLGRYSLLSPAVESRAITPDPRDSLRSDSSFNSNNSLHEATVQLAYTQKLRRIGELEDSGGEDGYGGALSALDEAVGRIVGEGRERRNTLGNTLGVLGRRSWIEDATE